MTYSILTEARVKPSVADLEPTERAYTTFWVENGNLEGWTSILSLDVVGAWNGFLFGTKLDATGGSIGPSITFPPVDARVNDRIFFRLKYDKHPKNTNTTNLGKVQFTTVSDPIFEDLKSVSFEVFPDGKWHLYELNMGQISTWVGDINNVRFFPCTNGARNDEFFLNFFEIGTNDFTFSFDNSISGRAGSVTSRDTLLVPLAITKDVNDKLIVNIDGYGDVQITLTPQTATPDLIARDVSLQLGKVGIGGYIRAEAFMDQDTNLMIIESGIRAANSSVQVKTGTNSAGNTLGFLDSSGTFVGTSLAGAAPDSTYSPLSAYRLTTLEVLSLFDNDTILPSFSLDPQSYVIEGGRRDFATTNRELSQEVIIESTGTYQSQDITTAGALDGQDKTLIDINHPFTDDGKLDKIFINGIADPAGSSKWKILRPSLDGTLSVVDEGSIGTTPSLPGDLVLASEPGVFVADLSTDNVQVRRGDLLGIFDADLHVGDFGNNKIDALYYQISGEVTDAITPPPPSGAGEAGLPIYARGSITRNKAVVDIDLNRRMNLDKLKVTGSEDSRDLEYNIATANSASFSVEILAASHVVCYTPPPFTVRFCFDRTNTAFNVSALNDNVIFAENGVSSFADGGPGGVGGASDTDATYFYINGDGEFLGTEEFVSQSPNRYGFTRDAYSIDCFFSSSTPRIDKPVGKAVIFFKDKKNQRSWQIETSTGSKGGDGSKSGFSLVPSDTISAIEIDNKKITNPVGFITTKSDSSANDILLRNPVVLDAIADDGTINPQIGTDFVFSVGELGGTNLKDQSTFINLQWNRFQWDFDAIRTDAFRYFTDFHWSTKISEFQIFAVSESQESLGDNTQVLFSTDGETFTTAALLTSNEGQADYKLGGSPQFLRLVFRPTLQLVINDISLEFEEDQVCFGEEGRIQGAISVPDAKRGATGASTSLKVANNTGETADLTVDLPVDIESARQLLYFSKLGSTTDITLPQVGPPGRVDFVPDKVLLEEENIAINARSYGLRSLVSGTGSKYITDNLFVNGGFETGDLTGWDLVITESGSKSFQIPGVKNFDSGPDEDTTAGIFQTGDFGFGFGINSEIAEQEGEHVPVTFSLSQTVDVSEFATEIDTGQTYGDYTIGNYVTYYSGASPTIRVMGAPTLSGANAAAGTIVDSSYGTNLLRSDTMSKSGGNLADESVNTALAELDKFAARLKPNTRFVRVELLVSSNDGTTNGSIKKQKFVSDEYGFTLQLPKLTNAKWYKSWRTGLIPTASAAEFDGWADTSFEPVSEFVATSGTTHWYQPFERNNVAGVPSAGQSLGFSNAFLADRFTGIQSFRRATISDPATLSAQWADEKSIAGFRIAMNHTESTTFFADAWPRFFYVAVLQTRAELGGVDPDIGNINHFKVAHIYRNVDTVVGPADEIQGSPTSFDGPYSTITTWLFTEKPIVTQGIKIVFITNCDKFERDIYANSNDFQSATGCPNDNLVSGPDDFVSVRGIGVSYFVPLESIGNSNLPVDNVIETHIGNASNPGTNMYVAVDLGRRHDIETDSDLFELISETLTQSKFNTTSVIFSADETDDPNQVAWTGGAGNARWIRFITSGSEKFEDRGTIQKSGTLGFPVVIENLPQAVLNQARIYPKISTTLITLAGYNCAWDDLGTTLADNKVSTKIFYSDYPVIALDLGKDYLIDDDASVIRKRHDLVGPAPDSSVGSTDTAFWDPDSETNWTYSSGGHAAVSLPERVEFSSYGVGIPSTHVRWMAVKGNSKLLFTESGDPPKRYRFQTNGQTLFYITVKPKNPQVITENSQWFTNKKSVLKDVSTFKFELGQPASVVDGIHFGSAAGSIGDSSSGTGDNLGDPYRAFDGQFDEFGIDLDIWGVATRDIVTGLTNSAANFPHSIWRVFRNTQTDAVESKSLKAITVLGFNENFYPTTFTFQFLEEDSTGTIKDPNLNSSWANIDKASFTSVDTYQEGFGFTYIFPDTFEAKGIRVRITNSVYVDDSVESSTSPLDDNQNNTTFPQTSGPQTRVASIVMYEELVEESTLEGTLDINHVLSSSVSASTSTSNHPISNIKDGVSRTYWQSTGFTDAVTISLTGARPITRFEWEIDPNLGNQSALAGTNAPQDFVLKGIVSGAEQTLLTETGFIGTTFSGTLAGGPITAKDFTLVVSGVQGEQEGANSIIINELKLIEVETRTTPLATVEDTISRRPGGTNITSTTITYAANSDAVAKITADGIDANNDSLWSQRDFFSLWVFINDISLLDTEYGSIKLGNDSDTFYRWDISGLSLQTGWNELKLQFKGADDISALQFQPGFQFDSNTGDSQVDFLTADTVVTSSVDGTFSQRISQAPGVRFFELEFRGTKGTSDLVIFLDDFRFVRNKFDDVCKFAPSLYLNNSEVFTVFLEGLDLATGTVEFWFQPDWDTGARLRADTSIIPALFRIMRPDGKFLSLFYRPNQGFVAMIFDGNQILQFVTNVSAYRFERFDTFHVALVWDVERRIQDGNTSLAMYINGKPVFGTDQTWDAVREGGNVVIMGGEVGQLFAATPDNPTAVLFTAVPTQSAKNTASTWGLIENLKMYNYAKTDFSDINKANLERTQLITPSEMLEISIDDVNFYGVGSANLPLSAPAIADGDSATVYIRTIIPRNLTGNEQRDASLLVRWKTPLKDCD